MSMEAHGQIGKALIFSKRKSGQMVRQFHQPRGARTGKQLAIRELMAGLTAYWKTFNPTQKEVYEVLAVKSGESMSGFNMFIRLAMADLPAYYGLQAFWPMEERNGDTVYDLSGNANDLILVPTVTRVDGKIGRALQFDGVGSSAQNLSPVGLEITGPFSFVCWAKCPATSSPAKRLIKVSSNYGTRLEVMPTTGLMHFAFFNSVASLKEVFSPVRIDDNVWRHYVGVYDGAQVKLYVDGVVALGTVTTDLPWYQINSVAVGNNADTTDRPFGGVVDDVRIFSRGLAASEVAALYALAFGKLGKD